MSATTGTVWNGQANNSYYRIAELVLPAFGSTGPRRFDFKTTFLPHAAGRIFVKSQGLERNTEMNANQPIEFESGVEGEIANATNEEIRFTVAEFKSI
jgi:hypothetical protein